MASNNNHQSKSNKAGRDTTQTPRWLFEAFNSQYHYVLDAAALKKSALVERYYTPRNNALKKDWALFRCKQRNPCSMAKPAIQQYFTVGK